MDELWKEALAVLDLLRAQPHDPVLPARVFVPFGVITARTLADVQREQELKTLAVIGGRTENNPAHPDHIERVRALCRMANLLEGTVAPQQFGSFPPVRH